MLGACSTMSVVGTGQNPTLTATIALVGLRMALLARKVRFRWREHGWPAWQEIYNILNAHLLLPVGPCGFHEVLS